MAKKALIVLLLVFCWLISEAVSRAAAEPVAKGECGLQIKNYSGEMIDV